MNIVLDTNVLISGLLTPFGPSGEIVRMIFADELTLCIGARILSEYSEVIHRPIFKAELEAACGVNDEWARLFRCMRIDALPRTALNRRTALQIKGVT
jgi:putative PIN family toxin of toxin-antitoxin system